MNKIISFLFSMFIILSFNSCQKEVIEKPNNTVNPPTNTDLVPLLIDKDWVLESGNFYYEDPKIYYTHPNVSCLNPFYGPGCDFDNLNMSITIWRFSMTQFFLNGVEQTEPNLYNNTISVGVYNGSNVVTRIIEVISITDTRLEVRVGELGLVIGNPYSVLVFRKSGTTTGTYIPTVPYGYQYQGDLNTNTGGSFTQTSDLYGTKWVVTKIYNGFGYDQPNDTLEFFSDNTYTINGVGNGSRTFNITQIVGNTSINLNLNNFITVGGNNYSIMTSSTFVSDGIINGSQFTDILNQNTSNKLIWMEKLP